MLPSREHAPIQRADVRRRRARRRLGTVLLVAGIAAVASGCGSNHSMMSPHGPDAGRTAALAWFMFSLAGLITIIVFMLLIVGLFRDGTRPGRAFNGHRLIIGGGIILPAIVLLTLSGLTVWTLQSDPAGASGDVAITVIGHQYWWEVRYNGTPAVTANEIHVPVGTQVRITLKSADVIHSFWVPALAGKVDLIPGHVNHITIRADNVGTFRGQCAEFCGIQHANMAFLVIAQPMGDYRAWLAEQTEPASAPSGKEAINGRTTFLTESCSGCHTIRGTAAAGVRGPDLTHLASRQSLAAETLPNDAAHLRGWITNSQQSKPGSLMPNIPINPKQTAALVAYLQELK